MAFETDADKKSHTPNALTVGGVGLKKGPSKAEVKQKQQEERIALDEERVYRKGVAGIKDLIAPGSMKVEPSFVRFGDVFCRTLFVVTYPRYTHNFPIINFTPSWILMFFIRLRQRLFLQQKEGRS